MSKLKVSLRNALKVCLVTHQNHIQKSINIMALLKSIWNYNPLTQQPEENKIHTYWQQPSIPKTVELADKLFEEEKYFEVYELLNRIKYTKEMEVLWRISRTLYYLSLNKDLTDDITREMIKEAIEMLNIALSIGENNANVHKWYAIIVNRNYEYSTLESHVKNFDLIQRHLLKACELNPNDFASHYLLGKLCYDMAYMSKMQRLIARYLVAKEPPKSTYQEAYKYLSRAEELQPRKFIPNLYYLGRTCLEIGQYYKGKYYLNFVISLPSRYEYEMCYTTSARHFIKKLERYNLSQRVLFYGDIDDPLGFND